MYKIRLLIFLIFTATVAFSQTRECKLILSREGKENAYPRLSKDQEKILFQSNRSGKWQLYIMDISGENQTLLAGDDHNNNFPDWSPDNEWVAFVSDRDSNEEIYLVKTDGSNLRRLTNDPGRDIHPYFSPDGKYILFNSSRGNGSLDIYRYTIETAKTERLTNYRDDETCARYSPDMKQIVFLRNSEVSDDVFLLNLGNFLSDNVTQTPTVQHGWPLFGPDGKWIYYSSMEQGTYSIYRISPDGKNKQQLTFAEKGEEDARVCISADGKMMIYNKRVGKTIEVWKCGII